MLFVFISECRRVIMTVEAMSNISGCEDTVFSLPQDLQPVCCLYVVRVWECGCWFLAKSNSDSMNTFADLFFVF